MIVNFNNYQELAAYLTKLRDPLMAKHIADQVASNAMAEQLHRPRDYRPPMLWFETEEQNRLTDRQYTLQAGMTPR